MGEGARWRYPPHVLDELTRHGVQPTPATDPRLVFDYVNDLYRYEIRRLRDRLIAGEFPKAEYAGRVVDLRRRYVLVSVRLKDWAEPDQAVTPGVAGSGA
ncbi:MAG: hypothetical protein KGN76_08570 [Acidobacteriota bacterium]|nr:hypothetical protein [Acidobacteriota bacterium]